MTLKKSSRKQFNAMFWQSIKKTCFFPLAALICLLFESVIHMTPDQSESYNPNKYGFFWDDFLTGPFTALAIACFIGAGIANAVLLYKFVSSKKQCNVVFSFGMSRNEIFISRYLAGIIPMLLVLIVAGLVELCAVSFAGYAISAQIIKIMLYMILSFYSGYALSFSLTAAVFCNIGNPFEGAVFTAILGIFPTALNYFIKSIFNFYTLGSFYQSPRWNWFNPFASAYSFEYSNPNYFLKSATPDTFTVFDFSGMINALALSAIIFVIALITFNRHKNEISGTWGRAKGLNEICGAVVGFYAFTVLIAIISDYYGHGNGSVGTFISCFIVFLIAYIVFKLIFGNKRKKELLGSLKRSPAYLAGFAAITIIFSTGLFGYSSFIPDEQDIASVEVSSQLWTYSDDGNASVSEYALVNASVYEFADNTSSVTFIDKSDISELLKVHSSVINDGKIRNNASNACGNALYIKYHLANGKTVYRFYTETTTGTAKKMIMLNNLNTLKNVLAEAIKSDSESANSEDTEEYGEYGEYNEYGVYYSDYEDSYNFRPMFENNMYIYPKDMKKGIYCGKITNELYNALLKDITSQTANEIFFHSPSDELGIISFGVGSDISYGNENIFVDTEQFTTEKFDPAAGGSGIAETSWNINSYGTSAFIITKSMTNTIDYLEKHDLMKYMSSDVTAKDVKSIKVATKTELFDINSRNVPLFFAGYWIKGLEQSNNYEYFRNYFDVINNEITNKTTIKSILDDSFLYGFCDNDYRIVFITYNDGSMATRCITLDTYNELIK